MAVTTVLVGTTKGAFTLRSDADRADWQVSGPHCGGWPINHVVGDAETGRMWAGGGNAFMGCGIWQSDTGTDWTLSKLAKGQMDEWAASSPDMAAMMGWEPVETAFDGQVTSIWSIAHDHGVTWAGGDPGMLFRSTDGGKTWENVESLSHHDTKADWNGGAAGLVLHSIVTDPGNPKKLWTAISAAGVFATEDGGTTWDRRNRLSNAEAHAHHHHPAAPKGGETGHCVHNIVRAPGSDLLYQQNHHGVFRSPDGGRNWEDVTEGLPSTFGFPIAVHPADPQTVWTLPLNGDVEGRFPPDASAAVWKSTDGGATWMPKRAGLPQKTCFFTVLRQGMATDRHDTTGVYFGTNSGSVFASLDEGETWSEIARHLPTVLSIEVMTTPD